MSRKRKFSLKNLLLFLIPILILSLYVVYIKQDKVLDDKWVSISEIKEGTILNGFDNAYIYCNSYENIREERFKSIGIILSLCSIVVSLLILIVVLFNNLKIEKNKVNNTINVLSNKYDRSNQIVSKFENDDNEIKVQQVLNYNFKNKIYNMFCSLQTACMNSDYETLQNLLTKDLYNDYCKGLATLKSKSKKNIVSDFELLSIKFIDLKEDADKYLVCVNIKVRYFGYIINTETKEIIRGSKSEKITNTYILSLVKYKNNSNDWLINSKEKVNEN